MYDSCMLQTNIKSQSTTMHNMLPFTQFPLFEGLVLILVEISSPPILLHCCVETRDWRLVTDCCLICSCICATISCNGQGETEDLAEFSSYWLQGAVTFNIVGTHVSHNWKERTVRTCMRLSSASFSLSALSLSDCESSDEDTVEDDTAEAAAEAAPEAPLEAGFWER